MRREEMALHMQELFNDCVAARKAGQEEYARDDDNAFRNFERISAYLNIPKEQVLLVYLMKHMDGIAAHVSGCQLQREPVRGRIVDAITYLTLLSGMLEGGQKAG